MFDIDDAKVQAILASFQVPAKPKILIELQQEQSKKEPNPEAFAEVIAKDVALSANVLKAVNSPVYGLKRKITDIRQGVILLGCDNISNLASFLIMRNSMRGKACISLEKFWDLTMQTANMMRLLIPQLRFSAPPSADDAYAFGLFRDCGIPMLAMKYSGYREVLMEANANPQRIFTDIEEHYYQTNHAVIGYYVASSWNLPASLCQLILRHHETDFLQANDVSLDEKSLYAMIKLASNILSQYKYQQQDSEWLLAKEDVLHYFGMSDEDYLELQADMWDTFDMLYG